jgi:DNA-binding NarL/FixJ family response regulator
VIVVPARSDRLYTAGIVFPISERKWHDGVIRVLVCDESALFRRHLVLALEATDDLEVVGEAPDADVARGSARQHAPDVVVLGSHLPPSGGLVAAAAMLDADPGLQLVFVYDPDDERDEREVRRALRLGALAVIPRGAADQDVARAVRAVVSGRPVLDAAGARVLLDDVRQLAARDDAGLERLVLDSREEQLLRLLADGMSRPAAAAELGLGTSTAANLVANVLRKLQRWARAAVRISRAGTRSAAR